MITASIKKFGYEIGEEFTPVLLLSEKLQSLQHRYLIKFKIPNEEDMLLKADDSKFEGFSFQGFVLRNIGFREIKFKINGDVMSDLTNLKLQEIEEVGIELIPMD